MSARKKAEPTAPPEFDDVLIAVARDQFRLAEPRQNHHVNAAVQTRPFVALQERAGSLIRQDAATHAAQVASLGLGFLDVLIPVAAMARYLAETARSLGQDVPPEVASFERLISEMKAPEAPAEIRG